MGDLNDLNDLQLLSMIRILSNICNQLLRNLQVSEHSAECFIKPFNHMVILRVLVIQIQITWSENQNKCFNVHTLTYFDV